MNIDDIADRKTNQPDPGDKFRQEWLDQIPAEQWPPYIDDTSDLVRDGIAIGETQLTKVDYPRETGAYYQQGLAATASIDPDDTSLPIGVISGKKIGTVAWVCNQLQRDIRRGASAIRRPSRAIEAAINKTILESTEKSDGSVTQVDTIRLPRDATVSEILSEIFCRPRSQAYIDALVDMAEEVKGSDRSFIQLVEEPRMTTRLWQHQQQALSNWIDAGYRGYVDMATATGKTVLGLAAIAHHYGALHPADKSDIEASPAERSTGDQATVLVVAHRDIILNQWKREFDKHLNIPEEGETDPGEHTASFSWGNVHFWTPSRLIERGVPDTDLVILDETHHYVGNSGFGSVLDDVDSDILALSGSLDEADARSLERRNIERVFHFTLKDGQRVGIIPQCAWDVSIVPYESHSSLARVTQQSETGMQEFADGPSNEELEDLDADRSELTFETFSEAQSVVRSNAGREYAKQNNDFREFSSAVKSRRLTQSNQSPALSRIIDLAADNIQDHKCVVLLESKDEVQTIRDGLKRRLGDDFDDQVITVSGENDNPLQLVEMFDTDWDHGAIVGTSQTLGEGVDIKTADVGINRGRGRLTHSLVQRMGRILRNPDGDKEARFYHVHGIPTEEEAILPREDGIWLLETASQLLAWGDSFDARPVFDAPDERVPPVLSRLEHAGAEGINDPEYEWPDSESVRNELETLRSRILESDEQSVLLAKERLVADESESISKSSSTVDSEAPVDSFSFISGATGQEVNVVEPLALAADALEATVDPGDTFVDMAVRAALQDDHEEQYRGIVSPRELTDSADSVTINPTLMALVRDETGGDEATMTAFVNDALAVAVAEYVAKSSTLSGDGVEIILSKLSNSKSRQKICLNLVGGVLNE